MVIFEAQDGSLAEWRKFGDSMNNVSSGNEHIETGTESLKLFGQFNGETNYSGIEQGISVTEGDRLMASVSALTAVGDSISGTENLVELKIDYYSELYGEFGTAQYISSDVITLIDGNSINDAWLQQELFSTAPAGAVEGKTGDCISATGRRRWSGLHRQRQFCFSPGTGAIRDSSSYRSYRFPSAKTSLIRSARLPATGIELAAEKVTPSRLR